MISVEIDVNYDYISRKYGYKRYRCKICGGFFWSRVPRETCPDRPCSKYEFLYKDYRNIRPLSIREVRERFIGFLRKRGHGLVDPYPVLAKWRNDLYLTIASIVVFQPEATDGLVEPPYNPLVIIQPSIRLTDIDNVGLTFGRHLSSFEMAGMHAFNKPGRVIYWSEGILDNTIDFFVDEVGVDLDDLVFKEGWWEGGGNAGPAPEVLVDGMELATLVHMGYKIIGGRREPSPVLVVDCGYGVERIAWFTQKTPTGFHSVYGALVNGYRDVLNVEEPPYEVLREVVYRLSDKDIGSFDEYVKYIEQLGYGDYVRAFQDIVYLYSTLDHVRTISLMLSDGIVPSNTGEGYLARLVIRRLLRNILKLGIDYHRLPETLLELVDMQIKHWKGDYIYGKLEKHRDYILGVLEAEAVKFINTVVKGIEIVDRVVKKKKKLDVEDLVELYDSHGIPPEFIAERAVRQGIHVEIPRDFYSMIASRHSSPGGVVKTREYEYPVDVVEWARGFRETIRLFHENPYLTSTESTVLGVRGNYVVLDKTIAYPWAGGQDHDEGVVRYGGDVYRLVHVGKIGDVIIHVLDREPLFREGDSVVVEIDWDRRYRLMKHHTATHIILASARSILGDHVWQAGAEKTTEKARLDITHYKPLAEEEVKKIEDLANSIVNSRIDLRFTYVDRFRAEEKYGLRIHQGGAVHTSLLRIVEIPGWDAQACFGTHLYNTSEVGGIKIVGTERIQDGVVRLEYIAGTRLVEYIRKLEEEKSNALSSMESRDRDLVSAVRNLYGELREQRELLSKYRGFLSKTLVQGALDKSIDICGIRTHVLELPVRDEKLTKSLVEEIVFRHKILLVLIADNTVEVSIDPEISEIRGVDLRKMIQELSRFNYRGGGKRDHVFLRAPGEIEVDYVLSSLKNTICIER